MREIKFRAWDKEDKKMIEVIRMTFYPNIGWSCCANCGLHIGIYPSRYELMQFTGLKDKSGREIYEGDILNGGLDRQGKVRWQELNALWLVDWKMIPRDKRMKPDYYAKQLYQDIFVSEVIGNIYENPELLQEPTQ